MYWGENMDLIELGNEIREARKNKGLTQLELGMRVNKTERTIRRYEKGEYRPEVCALNNIYSALDMGFHVPTITKYRRKKNGREKI